MDDASSVYQQHLDELIAFASGEDRKPDLLAAKAEFLKHTGEVFEDDKQFEQRMAAFLEFYLFDRTSPLTGTTPAAEYLEQQLRAGNADRAAVFKSFTETQHGVFEVRKLSEGVVKLREVFSGTEQDVTEPRQLVGLEKGDLIEARLIPFNGELHFSGAFCCHPKAAFKSILKEVKRRKKKEPERSVQEFTWECAKMALKADRYRQIAVEKIYEFQGKTI